MLTVPLRELKIVFVLSFHNNYSKEILGYFVAKQKINEKQAE